MGPAAIFFTRDVYSMQKGKEVRTGISGRNAMGRRGKGNTETRIQAPNHPKEEKR
jgi:hypothetical protein